MDREDLLAHSTGVFALLKLMAGRYEGIAAGVAEAQALFSKTGDRAMEAELKNLSAWGAAVEGHPREALRSGRERLAAAREFGDQDIHLADLHGLVLALLEVGDYEEALSVAHTGTQAARSLGSSERLYLNLLLLGDVYTKVYWLQEARDTYTEMSGAINITQYRALVRSKLCAAAALEGDWQEARDHAQRAARLRDEVVLQPSESFHRHHEIEALLRGGEEDLAREELRRFAEAAGENRRLRVAYLRARAVSERWEGDAGAAVESLREAEALAEEIGLPGELWQVRAALGELHEERGEQEEAGRCFSGAAGGLRGLAAKIGNEELRADFLAAAQVRRVLGRG